jgi:hypothetical protein
MIEKAMRVLVALTALPPSVRFWMEVHHVAGRRRKSLAWLGFVGASTAPPELSADAQFVQVELLFQRIQHLVVNLANAVQFE